MHVMLQQQQQQQTRCAVVAGTVIVKKRVVNNARSARSSIRGLACDIHTVREWLQVFYAHEYLSDALLLPFCGHYDQTSVFEQVKHTMKEG